MRSSRLDEIWWSGCISKSQRSLSVSFARAYSGLCIYHLFVWSNFNSLHNSQWVPLPCHVFYSFCANLLHSLNMWLIISSLSTHNLILLFCCVLSFLDLIWLWWRCFLLPLEEIQFLSLGLLFLTTSRFFRVKCRFLVALNVHSVFFLSSHSCFLVIVVTLFLVRLVLFLVAVISLPPRFSM